MSILIAVAFFFAALAVQRSLCKMFRAVMARFQDAAAEVVVARSHIHEHSR